ncbi:MAG: ABC transporter permease [Promicromonosporaceae bacterium]|nr:ABC transporter permease [Promicromonosporaceae bacterium]
MPTTEPLVEEVTPDPTTTDRARVSPWGSVWLIAKREIQVHAAQTSFKIMAAIILLAVVGGIVVLNHFVNNESIIDIGITDSAAAAPIESLAAAQGMSVNVLPAFIDQSAAEEAVRQGLVEAAVIGNPMTTPELAVVTDTSLSGSLNVLFSTLAQQSAFAREVLALGGDPGAIAAGMANAEVNLISLNPPPETDPGQLVVAMFTGILLYFALMMGAQFVAQGVVEEKASRVVEVLLSNVRPWQLMAGKVIGIGIVTLGLLFAVLLAGFIAAQITGIMAVTDLRLDATLLWAAIWSVVGFATFAVMLAALAARVSRQEEVGSVTTPAIMLMIIPYIFGAMILPNDPTNQIATVLSYVPLFSPIIMPIRAALGVASTGQVFLSLLISLAFLPLLLWVAAKVYSGAVLQTGGKVKLREALARA